MAPRASRSDWPFVDTIYCESKCPEEDVYYFGSDDDQYESPRERKRRYELAGQRFLKGSAPRLLSASLTGPFESSRGWKNPWASKTQSTRAARPEPQVPSAVKLPGFFKTTKHDVKHVATNTIFDEPQCHLPSPQSLKTASLPSEGHPFLEDEELHAVQTWRHSVRLTEPDAIQQSTPQATDPASSRKRKANHNWLKTVPDKRSRNKRTEDLASERPRTCTPVLPDLSIQGGERDRPRPTTKSSPRDPPNQLISPPKQSSAIRNNSKSTVQTNSKPGDEPSKEQQAAATLSSPVSLRNIKQEQPVTQLSPLKSKAGVHSTSDAASEWPGTSPPNTATTHCRASNDTIHKPYRVPDDEGFVFDIALDPTSDLSDSDDNESSPELEHTNNATIEEAHQGQPTSNDQLNLENDNLSDSELSELSDSPDLSDLEVSESESESESSEATDDSGDVSATTENANVELASETMDTPDFVHIGHHTQAKDVPVEDDSATGETANPRQVGELPEIALSHPVPEEGTGVLGSSEPQDISDAVTGQLPEPGTVEPEVECSTIGDAADVAAKGQVESELRVTAEPSTHPAADTVVQQSPKVKQESSRFSGNAMPQSFAPTNTRAHLTSPASGPTQNTQQPVLPTTMEEHILPSVEDSPLENLTPMVVDHGSEARGIMATLNNDDLSADEANEARQQLLSEQNSVLIPESLLNPQLQTAEDDIPIPRQEESDAITQAEVTSGSKLASGNETAEPEKTLLREPDSPCCQATAPTPSSTIGEMAPPAATPTTPTRTRTTSHVRKANSSEPRFAFKSFAAFATPSPERLRVKKRRKVPVSSLRHPTLKSILSSRNNRPGRRAGNRVSWLLPGEHETEARSQRDKADVPLTSRDARSSPPPRTPLAELPTASNEKFAKHFSSVVKRTDGLRHLFRVAADTDRVVEGLSSSQCTGSQRSNVASKSTTSTAMRDAAVVDSSDLENRGGPREASMSAEPMDMVEDMVREMGDFWQAWDVDAELDAAKKAQAEAAATESQLQSAWR